MKTNTPKLRFKEFTDEWQEKKLGDIGDIVTGNTPPTTDRSLYGKEYCFVSPADINNGRYIYSTNTKLSEKGFLKTRKIPAGSSLFVCIGSTIGKIAQASKEMATNQQINSVVPNDRYNKDFIFLSLVKVAPKISMWAGIQAVPIINKTDFSLNKIYSPEDIKEQEKIAGFLTTVDEKITKIEKKKKGFEKYKKGVMQAIFSQKIRFRKPDGSNYPDWEEKKLGEIGDFKTSSIDKIIYPNQDKVRLINYMNVYRHELINSDNLDVLSITSANKTQFSENNLIKGDILFTPSSETPSDIGHSVVIKEDLPRTVYSYHLFRFRPKIELDLNFSHYFCNISKVLEQISKRCQGSTRFTITVGEFAKVKIDLPKSIEEQKKIAEFLTSLDDKVELINKELEQTKLFKKSLLQQMFVQ